MILKDIDILNFKNIAGARLEFTSGVNCLLGMNGMGKSNLLEAIHYLGMARPMSSLPDSALVRHGEDSLLIKGTFQTDGDLQDTISCGISPGRAKRFKRNGKDYRRISEHIGRYPVVTVTPNDARLLGGSSEERRKLLDMVISQADSAYLQALIRYNQALESRNKMLRAGVKDSLLYESVETVMGEAAKIVYDRRRQWVEDTAPILESIYSRLAGRPENIKVTLKSQLNDMAFEELLRQRKQKDTILGFTSAGIHRDDLDISLGGYSMRTIGSQGQAKTFTVALKLAVFDFLKRVKNTKPLLLLDDIFDKLDASRVENIMQEVSTPGEYGQIFITDTNRKHLDDIIGALPQESILLNVSDGEFTPITVGANG